MGGKRKRHRPKKHDETPNKRVCDDSNRTASNDVSHPTLSLYYPQILTLRGYVLNRLPATSKTRRRKLVNLRDLDGTKKGPFKANHESCTQSSQGSGLNVEADLAKLLDKTLVCARPHEPFLAWQAREKEFQAFSQGNDGGDESSLLEGNTPQSEIVDFAIWLLFHRIHRQAYKPMHMLCHGYQRRAAPMFNNEQEGLKGIPGVALHYPNSHVATLKRRPWSDLLNLLGKDGEQIMLDLLLECAIYAGVENGKGNFYQLSGVPLSELQPMAISQPNIMNAGTDETSKSRVENKVTSKLACKSPSAITLVRNRMFYARAALNAKGKVRFGLRHIHVLNRYSDPQNPLHTAHVMKYVFPRQFGLHNAFTSTIDPKETIQPFKDYTLREQEIAQKKSHPSLFHPSTVRSHLPRRLRGSAFDLVSKLQKLHSRCAYYEILKRYCPLRKKLSMKAPRCRSIPSQTSLNHTDKSQLAPASGITRFESQSQPTRSQSVKQVKVCATSTKPSEAELPLIDYATPPSDVSAFCRAVIANIIPSDFWGHGAGGDDNKKVVLRNIDRFIALRRFESFTLHAVYQDLKIGSMQWLMSSNVQPDNHVSISDLSKRKELLLEFLYYLFDSILIPLVRSNFHVTESNLHKNRIFYFRHDVWRVLTEPALANIKHTMFEEVPTIQARKLLDARTLGFSQIRLLPKGSSVRPIMNLRRRVTKLQNGKAVLGRSINSIMAPVHKMLDYERRQNQTSADSALFSVGDMYPKLKAYRDRLGIKTKHGMPSLYFVKVDVQSCFDTIPQRAAVKIMQNLASEDVYRIARHAQIKASETPTSGNKPYRQPKPARKFLASAYPPLDLRSFDEIVEESLACERKNTVFVDNVVRTAHQKSKLLDMLKDHVERNIVKIGKKFFRQKNGIPQGSVLSSLLCNCFYAQLEAEHLSFVDRESALLLRLIDDFLLITTNEDDAKRFLQIMHDGLEEYGVRVNPAKSLANFNVKINGSVIPKTVADNDFPYCGTMVSTKTLEIRRDRDRGRATALADSLTVEQSSVPGQTFHRKAINAFKIQTHKMFLDTNFNSLSNAISNIYQNFVEAGMKYYRYVKSMRAGNQPHSALLIDTIRSLVDVAFILIQAKHRSQTSQEYNCAVSKRQVQWLALTAFTKVLGRKQTKFQAVLVWANTALEDVRPRDSKEELRLVKAMRKGDAAFRGYSGHLEYSTPSPAIIMHTDFSSDNDDLLLARNLLHSVYTWDLSVHFNPHSFDEYSPSQAEDYGAHFFFAGISIFVEPPTLPNKPVSTFRSLANAPLNARKVYPANPITTAYNDMASLATQAPSSPPGLTGSKSSKSSSFHSSSHEGTDALLSDITHFEDIGLDEEPILSTRELYGYDSTTKPPPPQAMATAMNGKKQNAAAMTNTRDLTAAGQRPKFGNAQRPVKPLSGLGIIQPLAVHGPNGFKRGHRSPSSPSLAQQAMSNLSRSRSPSPSHPSARSASLQPLQRPATLQGPALSSAPKRPPIRRGSWQPSRKSIKELEDEYVDEDEDLPDDASLWNVPLSPRPPTERSAISPGTSPAPSTRTSPERQPAFNPKEGSLKDLRSPRMPPISMASREVLNHSNGHRTPPIKSIYPPSLSSAGTMPVHHPLVKARAKSWTVAMSELSDEAKSLTEALESHVDLSGKLHEDAVQSGLAPIRPSIEKSARSKTSVELPPLRMNNVMIDPLPISKEKERVLSRTRPSWLPPKDQKEEKKHLKEYQRMMELSLEAERKKAARAAVQKCADDDSKTSLRRIWEEHVLPNWDQAMREPRTRELWWRGISPRSRATVWQKAIGNNLTLSENTYTKALQRANDTEVRIAASRGEEPQKEKAWFKAIRRDANVTLPELKMFQGGGPLHDGLVDVLMAYSMYRSDVGYSHGTHLLAAILLLTLPSASATFISLANLLNRPLPLAFLTGDPAGCAKAYSLVFALLEHKYPRLHTHLFSPEQGLDIHPHEIFEPVMRMLFLGPHSGLGVEAASRVWDVMVFDGDAAVVRTVVGLLGWLEGRLYGSREEVLGVLGWRGGGWGVERDVEGFMKLVRDVGKERVRKEKR
ncbi:MAG: hypothetical protein Q9186_003343 [Xanthomendoza sp. 1 TL-2023]